MKGVKTGGVGAHTRRILDLFRTSEWFSSKLPPIFAVAYGQILVAAPPAAPALARLAALFLALLCLAAFGYLVNDACDLASDRRAGRQRKESPLSGPALIGTAALLFGSGISAFWLVGAPTPAIVLLALNFTLALLYSAPPIRLKERGLLGVLADALGAHALPVATACALFGVTARMAPLLAVAWAASVGLRGILLHQLWDRDADLAAGVRTFVGGRAPDRVRAFIRYFLFPVELILLFAWLGSIGTPAWAPALVAVASLGTDLLKLRLWRVDLCPAPRGRGAYVIPASLYQAWLPLALAARLTLARPLFAVVLAAHALVFVTELRLRAVELARLLGDMGRRWRAAHRPAPPPEPARESAPNPVRPRRAARVPSSRPRVVVASNFWTLNGVNIFSANLVRGLRDRGFDASILFTEERTQLVQVTDPRMPWPDDLPHDHLPVTPQEGWGAHWGAMIRFLEERAPCIYVPNSDWRHSCVTPLLADTVAVAGVVHSDDPLHYDHVRRLGASWNAVVTVSRTVAEKAAAFDPEIAPRLSTIPIGVEVPAERPRRASAPGSPLRVVYHGLLNQRQKRILDLIGILDRAESAGLPIELTLVGGGNQQGELQERLARHAGRGSVRFTGVLSNPEVLRLLESQDAFLMTSEFEGMPNALVEAMGRGCVPVVTRTESGIPELVRDEESGLLVPIGDLDAFVDRLGRLHADAGLRDRLSGRAFELIRNGPNTLDAMCDRWAALCTRLGRDLRQRKFRRSSATLSLPPPTIDGLGIFPVACPYRVEGVGSFPSAEQHRAFESHRRASSAEEKAAIERRAAIRGFRVVVALPYWTLTGVTVFAAHLVRGLVARGVDAEILLTEDATELITIPDPPLPVPPDLPVRRLPVSRTAGWGARWAAMQCYLEERAPCVYLPNYDWRQSCVAPRLSRRVSVVGILHGDDPLHYDHLRRQGRYWDAVVAVSDEVAERAAEIAPDIAGRLATIAYGIEVALPRKEEPAGNDGPLRLVYHGVLNVRQKRILDLPQVVERALARGVPVELTVIGGGPDEGALREAAAPLVERGAIRLLGVRAHQETLAELGRHDVYLMTSAFEGLPNALIEAMSAGCVPVVSAIRSGIPELVEDGESGFVVPIGDVEAFAERIERLWREPELRRRMSSRATAVATGSIYQVESMVADYLTLFQRVLDDARRGVFRRPPGLLEPPPREVEGVSLFPVECVDAPGLGRFPAHPPGQAVAYRAELVARRLARLSPRLAGAARAGLESAFVRRVGHGLGRAASRLRLVGG